MTSRFAGLFDPESELDVDPAPSEQPDTSVKSKPRATRRKPTATRAPVVKSNPPSKNRSPLKKRITRNGNPDYHNLAIYVHRQTFLKVKSQVALNQITLSELVEDLMKKWLSDQGL